MSRLAVLALLLGCSSGGAREAHTSPPGRMPEARDVCVEVEGGLVAGRAHPSRAGVYDPGAPTIHAHLDWRVEGRGCVSYPGEAARTATCGGEPAPVVSRVPCQQ